MYFIVYVRGIYRSWNGEFYAEDANDRHAAPRRPRFANEAIYST